MTESCLKRKKIQLKKRKENAERLLHLHQNSSRLSLLQQVGSLFHPSNIFSRIWIDVSFFLKVLPSREKNGRQNYLWPLVSAYMMPH
ncbi:hypothetical protein TNCT_15661 [Trichonephila clavata]|uniref:Uncharacterized protein n=1 Tax=Trichonephila clavata TaxID=2740835 RepID=A0A8X6HJU6_TRICU|nr:hypothetical protein TNCT_15661 [Trichonephila clavata]